MGRNFYYNNIFVSYHRSLVILLHFYFRILIFLYMSLYDNFKVLVATRRPIGGHFIHYHDDGTGRDNYIANNNGGLNSSMI